MQTHDKYGNQELGKKGEELAKNYLIQKGYKFLISNYRYGRVEIDLIFLDVSRKLIVFVEVKTRRTKTFGEPEQSLTYTKRKNFLKAVNGFLYKNQHYQNYDVRIDAVTVYFENTDIIYNHIENAFY